MLLTGLEQDNWDAWFLTAPRVPHRRSPLPAVQPLMLSLPEDACSCYWGLKRINGRDLSQQYASLVQWSQTSGHHQANTPKCLTVGHLLIKFFTFFWGWGWMWWWCGGWLFKGFVTEIFDLSKKKMWVLMILSLVLKQQVLAKNLLQWQLQYLQVLHGTISCYIKTYTANIVSFYILCFHCSGTKPNYSSCYTLLWVLTTAPNKTSKHTWKNWW